MGEATGTEKAPKKSFFKGVKAEFSKIVWPDQETVGKQTVVVLAVTAVLGLITQSGFHYQMGPHFIINKARVIRLSKQNGDVVIPIRATRTR